MDYLNWKFKIKVLLPLFVGFVLLPVYGVSPINYQTTAYWAMENEVRLNDYRNKIESEVGVVALVLGENDSASLPTLTAEGEGYNGTGKALSFGGGNQAAYSNDYRASDNNNIGIEFYFKTPDVTTAQTIMIIASHFEIRIANGELIFYVFSGTSGSIVGSVRDNVSADVWNDVKIVANNGEVSLQINDSAPVVSSPVSLTPNGNRLIVGCRQDFGERFYTGLLDDIHFKDLDSEKPAYLGTYEDTPTLHGLWKMDDLKNIEDEIYVLDYDPNNLHRTYGNLKLVTGAQGKPQLAITDNYPNDDAAFGKCVEFKGYGDHLEAESLQKDLGIDKNNFRVECWFKLGGAVNGTGNVYTVFSNNNGYKLYARDLVAPSEDVLRLELRVTDDSTSGVSDVKTFYINAYDETVWNHVAAEFSGGQYRLYLNDSLVNSGDIPGSGILRTSTESFMVGSEPGGANSFWGYIDEVRVSPVSLECGMLGYPESDINKDCYVDIIDLRMMLDNWLLQY
jgi:hypothetical protein